MPSKKNILRGGVDRGEHFYYIDNRYQNKGACHEKT